MPGEIQTTPILYAIDISLEADVSPLHITASPFPAIYIQIALAEHEVCVTNKNLCAN